MSDDRKQRALDSIAGLVGLDPFGEADPADVYQRVLQKLKEHEEMSGTLAGMEKLLASRTVSGK